VTRSRSEADGAVARLYEDYPYPAHGIVSSVIARMAAPTLAALRRDRGAALSVLDAGCGTGEQALGIVQAAPDVEMTGIDYSEASVRFAQDLAIRHQIRARFIRGDLAEPIDAGPFDLIVCVGTLHHLADPERTLRHFHAVIRPSGRLFGMVYGTFGKADLFRARDALDALAGPGAAREEKLALLSSARLANNTGPLSYLRTLNARRRFGPDIEWTEALRRVVGGRSASYQADAYTHPREVSYTWDELAEMLRKTGWRWLGWPARSGMPDDPRALFSGDALRSIQRADLSTRARVYERIVCPPSLYFLAEPER
jgi:SAM-dependent methyltransferase